MKKHVSVDTTLQCRKNRSI